MGRIDDLVNELGSDEQKRKDWFEFYYQSEPLVAAVIDYAEHYNIVGEDKVKLVTSIFMRALKDQQDNARPRNG